MWNIFLLNKELHTERANIKSFLSQNKEPKIIIWWETVKYPLEYIS